MKIDLSAERRDDGMMFVTSPTHPYICAVVDDGNWNVALQRVRQFVEVNYGPVTTCIFIGDEQPLERRVTVDFAAA